MMKNFYNPFTECTARDMSFDEVEEYWCSPYNAFPKVDEVALHKCPTPIIIEGPRGSGKTMLLKHISYFCQKKHIESDSIITHFSTSGDLAVYFRYKDDFGCLFDSLLCSNDDRSDLFVYYFELFISQEILSIINDLFEESAISLEDANQFAIEFSEIVGIGACSFELLSEELEARIKELDKWVRRSRYVVQPEDTLRNLITNKNIIKKVCKLLRKIIPEWNNLLFVFIIDEYENASKYQKELNSLIKQVDEKDKLTYRIGVRPNGLTTSETNVGEEFIQNNRDYLLYSMSIPMDNKQMSQYKSFLRDVANKRLQKVPLLVDLGLANIELLLGKKEVPEEEARNICKKRKNHFQVILGKKYSNKEKEEIYHSLKNEDNPLLEMLNLLWFQRGKKANDINIAMNGYINNNYHIQSTLSYKYYMDYVNKYKFTLLYMLISIYGAQKQYYSFNTFAYLSTGAINDFISLCRNTFYQIDEQYILNMKENKQKFIETKYQTQGAYDTSIEQLNIIKMRNDNGNRMYCFVMNLGNLFREYHKDLGAKYPETNQFAFSDIIMICEGAESKSILNSLLSWGVIIKKKRLQSLSIGQRKGEVFLLNKIFAPLFNISYRTRGGFNPILSQKRFLEMSSRTLSPLEIKELLNNNHFDDYEGKQISLF